MLQSLMSKKVFLDQIEFDSLLEWLSPDRDEAGNKYESIRLGLIRYFRFKGCAGVEDLADETINRVAKKLPSLDITTGNEPITYFYGFASKVFLEELRRRKKETDFETINIADKPKSVSDGKEIQFECLEQCLSELGLKDNELVINYYSKNKSEKFVFRQKLAESLDISLNGLHVKVHRLRNRLQVCVQACLNKNSL